MVINQLWLTISCSPNRIKCCFKCLPLQKVVMWMSKVLMIPGGHINQTERIGECIKRKRRHYRPTSNLRWVHKSLPALDGTQIIFTARFHPVWQRERRFPFSNYIPFPFLLLPPPPPPCNHSTFASGIHSRIYNHTSFERRYLFTSIRMKVQLVHATTSRPKQTQASWLSSVIIFLSDVSLQRQLPCTTGWVCANIVFSCCRVCRMLSSEPFAVANQQQLLYHCPNWPVGPFDF